MRAELLERIQEMAARAGLGAVPPRAVIGVAVVAVGAGVWWASRWLSVAPSTEETFAAGPVESYVPAESGSAVEESGTVVVHVCGAVCAPGVYELAHGSRVSDAVAAAGGLLAGAAPECVNLARVLSDGEQISVPSQEDVAAGRAGPYVGDSVTGGAAGGPIDLNSASAAELETLPGIGPSTAARIVEDRSTNGPFASVEDLQRVSGIGPSKFDAVKDLVTVR